MYHFIYKTTNLITKRFYIGMHSTENLKDGYMGSGKILQRSIAKYGLENHQLEIIKFYDSRVDLRRAEAEFVTRETLDNPLCMNLKLGGFGGWDYINKNKLGIPHFGLLKVAKCGAKAIAEKKKSDPEFRKRCNEKASKALRERFRVTGHPWTGRNHNDETKVKMSESHQGKHVGSKNSQYGTCWIHNDTESIKIKVSSLDSYLQEGWIKGRKMKF